MINKEKNEKKTNSKKQGIVEEVKGHASGRLVIRDKETGQTLRDSKG